MKTYILTGSSNGIGKTIKKALLEHNFIVLDIDKCGTPYFLGDISKQETLDLFYNQVIKEYTKIDGIINNACLSLGGIDDCSFNDFNYVFNTGVTAPFYLAKLFKNHFKENSSIVNISSTRALMSQPNTESYSAAKGGISALTHSLAVSLSGIARVNSISPGWINTTNDKLSSSDLNQHPTNTVGNVEDISSLVLFLLSNSSSFINAENITIDGGMSKQMIYHNDHNWEYHDN